MVAEGDKVAFLITIKDTENGKPSIKETYFARFKGGKVTECGILN